MSIAPDSRPKVTRERIEKIINDHGIDRDRFPVVVVGVRGYYLNSMGKPGINDRGLYDDMIAVCTPTLFAAFNGNTDPSKYRKGSGRGSHKGMARLKPGAWPVYKIDIHGGSKPHQALCQRVDKVTVIRDGEPDYEDTGMHGINIHRGGTSTTSSLGCQTIPPNQWPSFIGSVKGELARYGQKVVTYILVEEEG
jgi:lysozyme